MIIIALNLNIVKKNTLYQYLGTKELINCELIIIT